MPNYHTRSKQELYCRHQSESNGWQSQSTYLPKEGIPAKEFKIKVLNQYPTGTTILKDL